MPVKLNDIIEALDLQHEEWHSYLDKASGEIVGASQEELDMAARGVDLNALSDCQKDSVRQAQAILRGGDGAFLPLPTKHDIHEHNIMYRFVNSLDNPKVTEALSETLYGKGAFGRFKTGIAFWSVEKRWHDFKYLTLKEIAVHWCEEHHIPFKDNSRQVKGRNNPTSTISPTT